MIQNRSDLTHFHQESRSPAGEVVAGAYARKDAVDDGKFSLARGNERAGLRHQGDQRGLPQIGGLAAHVRAGDQEELLGLRLEVQIVGDKALAALPQELFNDRMPPADDQELAAGGEFRPGVTAVGRQLGERG